jgi:hypothetical protein
VVSYSPPMRRMKKRPVAANTLDTPGQVIA